MLFKKNLAPVMYLFYGFISHGVCNYLFMFGLNISNLKVTQSLVLNVSL